MKGRKPEEEINVEETGFTLLIMKKPYGIARNLNQFAVYLQYILKGFVLAVVPVLYQTQSHCEL
jgi:hypothetical protein